MKKTNRPQLPDFDLGELQHFKPELLLNGSSEYQRCCSLIISLALVFNDFKGIEWWFSQLRKNAPANPNAITAHNGQYNAMTMQTARISLAIFFELLELLRQYEDVFQSNYLSKCLQRVGNKNRKRWSTIVHYALGTKSLADRDAKVIKLLERIRKKATFHYDGQDLRKAYKQYFRNEEHSPQAQRAYVSLGENLEQTRFFFADGAVYHLVQHTIQHFGETQELIAEIKSLLAEPLERVIEAFLIDNKLVK